jgi:uncharacterized protein
MSLNVEPFHILAKPAGASCNLRCAYCFYRAKDELYAKSKPSMSEEVLESYIRQLIEMEPTDQVVIAWQGGEPTLLGIDFYKRAVNIASKYLPDGKQIQWTIQTNGTLLTDEWCDFFIKNNFLVGLSMDGPRELHNRFRVDQQGKGTFDSVMHAVDLLKAHNVEFNILCCVHSENQNRGLEVYRFLRDIVGAHYIQFIPIVEYLSINGQSSCVVSNRSVEPIKWGQFLIDVFDEWIHKDVGEVFVLMFDWTLASWIGLESPVCIFRQNCGKSLVLEWNGDVFSCDHFVDNIHFLGNILEVPLKQLCKSNKQLCFGNSKGHLPKCCRDCTYSFACHGECPKNRLITTPTHKLGLNYLCIGYKVFFAHTAKPMQIMANLVLSGRSASEIMSKI